MSARKIGRRKLTKAEIRSEKEHLERIWQGLEDAQVTAERQLTGLRHDHSRRVVADAISRIAGEKEFVMSVMVTLDKEIAAADSPLNHRQPVVA